MGDVKRTLCFVTLSVRTYVHISYIFPSLNQQETGDDGIVNVSPHEEDPGWPGMTLLEPPSRIRIKEALAEKRQTLEDAKRENRQRSMLEVEKQESLPMRQTKDT